jgi:hypothetical protein
MTFAIARFNLFDAWLQIHVQLLTLEHSLTNYLAIGWMTKTYIQIMDENITNVDHFLNQIFEKKNSNFS